MRNQYLVLIIIIFSFSCKTEDVEPIVTPPVNTVLGCTDANAVNYNSDANFDLPSRPPPFNIGPIK